MLTALVFLAMILSPIAMVDIIQFEGSWITLLIIAAIAIVVLAVFRFLIPLIIAGIVIVVLLILIFGRIPVPSFG